MDRRGNRREVTSAAADCSKLNDSSAKKDLSIVYTPLFGSGRDFVLDALEKDGFSQVHLVKKQAGFDGKFPGLRKPNPEEPEVFRIAEREALEEHADLMIATDPDSDRIGAGVIQDSKSIFLYRESNRSSAGGFPQQTRQRERKNNGDYRCDWGFRLADRDFSRSNCDPHADRIQVCM